jgi:hypothetical protein
MDVAQAWLEGAPLDLERYMCDCALQNMSEQENVAIFDRF